MTATDIALTLEGATLSVKPAQTSPAVPKTPRSMLRNLFAWKKTSVIDDTQKLTVPTPTVDGRPQTSSSTSQQPTLLRKPSFSQRSRSDTCVPQRASTRSKSRRRSRSRCRAVWDPPPLFKAYREACMHDTLQIPSKGFLDWLPRNTSGRSSAKNSDNAEDDKDDNEEPPIRHRRSLSDSSSTSLSKKLLFLFENGHILQYKAEGSLDRLPERVLELSRESVAFASDAVSGQHWVLEIAPHGGVGNDHKAVSIKIPWSGMSLKTTEAKRLADRLLLVFDSPDALDNWLFAIRKQIEGLGGLEYQPDAPPLPQAEHKRPTLRHASSEYFKRKHGGLPFSRSSSALPLRPASPLEHEKELPKLPADLTYHRSTSIRSAATSSVATASSLDRYRESYSGSSTAGTALSSDMSSTSLSPTKETFLPLMSPLLGRDAKTRTTIERSIPKTPSSPLSNSEAQSEQTKPLPSQEGEGQVALPDSQSSEVSAENKLQITEKQTSIPQVVIASEPTDQVQTRYPPLLEPLPVPELRKKLRQAQRNLSSSGLKPAIEHEKNDSQGEDKRHVVRPSLSTSAKGSYGLFPKKLALNVQAEPLVVPDQNHVPGLSITQATSHLDISHSPITPVASTFGANLFARSNTTFKRPVPIALPHLLSVAEPEQPMRSPAVTDAMLDTNFGTSPGGDDSQPATPIQIKVPSFSDIQVDASLFDSVRQIEGQDVSPSESPKAKNLTPRRSLPNFHYGSASVATAPVGPPPRGPLPAVPPVNENRGSRTSTPSKRTSTQGASNRRASTRSASTTRKGRSPAPSFSSTPSQPNVPLMPETKSLSATEKRVTSPISHAGADAPTIGQVSVVASPPIKTTLPQHRKSLSTSSLKSNRSRRTHGRSPSSKSIHASIPNIPSISHLIPPPCGIRSESEYAGGSCFGITAARSST